jgi:F0F1-type ATP synthase assembly protein I
MGQSRKTARQRVMVQRQSRKRRRMAFFIGAPVVIAAIAAVVVLTSQAGYSGFDVIGKQPAVVQVFLPG